MSSERIYGLYKELLGLAEDQLNALQEERFNEALIYLEKRQRIIDEIHKFDATGKNDHELKDISHKIIINIEKIISVDTENQDILKAILNSISHRLEAVQKAKTFCNNVTYSKRTGMFNLTV